MPAMSRSKDALEAWQRADADARIVEARLLAVWDLYEKGLVAAPDEALLRDVFRLRAAANERLMGAIAVLGALSSEAQNARRSADTA